MSAKQAWLRKRLLIPAGILPPAIKFGDLVANERCRLQIGNAGFEYFYLMNQKPEKLSRSAVGRKIFAVHAPFPFFGHATASNNPLVRNLITNILYGKNRIPNDNFPILASRTFRFAAKVKAKVVVFHTYSLDHYNLQNSLSLLANLEEKYRILPTIEHEGAYLPSWHWKYFKKINGSFSWMENPIELLKILDRLSPSKKFSLCLDTCSLKGFNFPIASTITKIASRIGHVHLADTTVGHDQALEISSFDQISAVNILYSQKYSGYITAEVNGTMGKKEEFKAQIYGLSAKLGGSFLKKTVYHNAQRHIENSCQYLLKNSV